MSMTGSLMSYENNNEVSKGTKKGLKPLPVVASVNAAGMTTTTTMSGGSNGALPRAAAKPRRPHAARSSRSTRSAAQSPCGRGHVNSLWSCWYGIIAVGFQAYIAVRCTRRFIAYLSLPWPLDAPPPKLELHACLVLACAGVLLLPILLASACLKLGNLANDGVKLGRHLSTCSRDPPSSLLNGNTENGLANNLWRHGGPTSAFVHLCTAMCFLLPSLLMEARLIHAGFLPKEAIWRTDLDWVLTHRERLVMLSFMNIPENASLALANQPVGGHQSFADDQLDDITNATSYGDAQPTKLSTVLLPSTMTNARRNDDSDADYNYLDAASSFTSPSSPSSSRRPGQRMQARNIQNRQRAKSKKNSAIARARSTPTPYGNMTALSLPLTFTSLEDLDHPEYLNQEIDESEDDYGPVTLEYLNYAMALGVYSVRYPAVFWASNKALGTIFSIQLVFNSLQSLLSYAGMSVLYKVQVVGPLKVLPLLRHRSFTTARTLSNLFGDRFFLLNPHITLGIFALSSLLVLCSSMVMYLYAYGRFVGFLSQERERRVILPKGAASNDAGWTYMTHPAALCLFLALAICNAPLLYDYTVVYRGSLDGAVLACAIGTIFHLGVWLVIWIGLAIKKRWVFKLRVTIGRATVRSARSVKLVTDVDLMNGRDDEDGTAAPLLVVGNGRTYTVAETSPKKAIMSVIQKAAMERKARSQGNGIDSMDGDSTADGDEQIYWLRPKLRASPMQAAGNATGQGAGDKSWLNKKLKQKVTFNDLPSTSGSRNKGKARRDGGPEDDGDYATLRELPLAHDLADDSTSEENKPWGGWLSPRRDNIPRFTDLLECVNDDQVTYYASGHRDLQPSEDEPSSLLSPEPPPPPPPTTSAIVTNEGPNGLPLPPPDPSISIQENVQAVNSQVPSDAQTPRCLRRGDSGMPHEELTPRSDSSHSPPLDPNSAHLNGGASNNSTSSNSETSSSGVHSTASSQRRATSVEDLTNEPREEPQWRSCSLQRGTAPPTSSSGKYPPSNPGRVITNPTANYANSASYAVYNGCTTETVVAGCQAVILENPNEATVVIRRKNSRTKLQEPPLLSEEPFGRSTNMRMTSFTENSDLRSMQSSSATLPHYPTQPVVTYPHCSTMPLPHASHNIQAGSSMSGSSGSCGSVPRHPVVPEDPEEDIEDSSEKNSIKSPGKESLKKDSMKSPEIHPEKNPVKSLEKRSKKDCVKSPENDTEKYTLKSPDKHSEQDFIKSSEQDPAKNLEISLENESKRSPEKDLEKDLAKDPEENPEQGTKEELKENDSKETPNENSEETPKEDSDPPAT
ncbi:protein tincar isoform X2 [Phymastichus coffea]|uniref:protein tincar isoform X2 n=1 Tax=Phymastichus coffea TaxID=108790 RepID=UPI00273B9441|nr:protein tincar isoform X2 [Phymastichus coffea]